MSTRGNVIFIEHYSKKDFDFGRRVDENAPCIKQGIIIYKHFDMSPDSALPVLKKFLNIKGARNRGDDCEYLSAWYVAYLVNNMIRFNLGATLDEMLSEEFKNTKRGNEDIEKCSDFSGVGISTYISNDISYLYIVEYVEEEGLFRIHIYDSDLCWMRLVEV